MKAIVIHESGAIAIQEMNSLEDLQRAVGGYIEVLTFPDAVAYINEEGKLDEMEINRKATNLFRQYFGYIDYIVGPMVILGPTDSNGNDTPVPQSWIDKLIGGSRA